MKETWYFSHDYNSQQDEKIQKLMAKHKWEGYGLFWGILELLYQNEGYMEYDCERIAFVMRTESERIADIISNFGLFFFVDGKFGSHSVNRRLAERKLKSEKAKKSAKARWKRGDANAMRAQCERNAIKESKVKERKVNNKISSNEDIGEVGSPTPPRETMKEFCLSVQNKDDRYKAIILNMSTKLNLPVEKISAEIDKFLNYWCELSQSGTKQRWQLQRVFEVQRRLATWFANSSKFGAKNDKGSIVSV